MVLDCRLHSPSRRVPPRAPFSRCVSCLAATRRGCRPDELRARSVTTLDFHNGLKCNGMASNATGVVQSTDTFSARRYAAVQNSLVSKILLPDPIDGGGKARSHAGLICGTG